ncbi:1299_t:CDS:1 [Ambispora leptoticha]|uniref:1299_t:CDS:1 n=1 Tax=Ambispora leptoticha TaxID=144679 RepID=A0A9N9GC55_9GLOM|nr:1299_t:CDS:1 [Ambispora leptoticha]
MSLRLFTTASRLSSVAFNNNGRSHFSTGLIRPSAASLTSVLHAQLASTSRGTPTVYEADKDYWSLKTTIDDIRAKYGLKGGSPIKDPNLDQHSDELEVDITAADAQKLLRIQSLLENAARDLNNLISNTSTGPDGQPKKQVWLAEDDDVSGNAQEAIKSFQENYVAGDVDLNAYHLEENIDEKPVGFQNFYKQ